MGVYGRTSSFRGQPPLQSRKPHRPTESRAGVARTSGQPGEQLGLHADDGLSLEPEGLVGIDPARNSRPLARETSRRKTMGAETGIQDVPERIHAPSLPDPQDWPQAGLQAAWLEPASVNLLSFARRAALLNRNRPEVGIRTSRSPITPNASGQKGRQFTRTELRRT